MSCKNYSKIADFGAWFALGLAITGCLPQITSSPPAPAVTTTPFVTVAPTLIPTNPGPLAVPTNPGGPLPPRCRVEGQTGYADPTGKYCLAFPPRFKPHFFAPGRVEVSGPALDTTVEPVFATLIIKVGSVKTGLTLKQAVDAFVNEQPKTLPGITRQAMLLGSEPAERLENVPGRMTSRNILLLHDDKLYNLYFQPLGIEKAQADVEALYNAVIGSFSFLPDLSWDEAQKLILDGKVKQVSQAHSLFVLLTLADGRTLKTIEPRIDAVLEVVKQCGAKCAGLRIATE